MKANKPIHELRIGTVKAAIWRQEGTNGSFFTITLSRIYKVGAAWKRTSGFGAQQLPVVAEIVEQANAWINAQALA